MNYQRATWLPQKVRPPLLLDSSRWRLEFRGMDPVLLNKVLQILVKRGVATIFKGADGEETGVKFFGSMWQSAHASGQTDLRLIWPWYMSHNPSSSTSPSPQCPITPILRITEMIWPRLTGNNLESLELQKAYNFVSPRRGFIIMNIFFQCVLGTACIVPPLCPPVTKI